MSNKKKTVKELLGQENINRYKYIYPLVDLILYRVADGNYSELYAYDGMVFPKSNYKRNIRKKYRGIFKYFLSTLKIHRYCSEKQRVLFSESIVQLNRLEEFNKLCYESCEAFAIYRYADFRANSNKTTYWKSKYRPVFFGSSVMGDKIKKNVCDLYVIFESIFASDTYREDDKKNVEKLLCELERNVRKRVRNIKKIIKKERIDLFITYNQDRVADLLIIMACRELDVWTKEVLHYWYPTARPFLRTDVCNDDYKHTLKMYANESCQWGDYRKELYRIKSRFEENILVTSVGCPEICLNDINVVKQIRKNYTESNIIVFWPDEVDIVNDNYTKERNLNYLTYRLQLLHELKELSNKSGMNICIRIHPFCEFESEIKDAIEGYGFILVDSLNVPIRDSIAEARLAIGGVTSALYISKKYGLRSYCVVNDNYSNRFMDEEGIKLISIKEISSINYKETSFVEPTGSIDIKKVLSIPKKQ